MIDRNILLLISISFVSISIRAQVLVPTSRTIQTPKGSAEITGWRDTGLVPYYFNDKRYPTPFPLSVKGDYTVVTNSDSVIADKMTLTLADTVNNLVIQRSAKKGGDIVIRPSDTKQVRQMLNGRMLTGIPSDSCWLFNIIPGTINSYAPFATDNSDYVIAIQKENGPIVPMTKENLSAMVGQDTKLLKLIENGKLYEAVWKYNGSK